VKSKKKSHSEHIRYSIHCEGEILNQLDLSGGIAYLQVVKR